MATRKPDITSSKIRSAPCAAVSERNPFEIARLGRDHAHIPRHGLDDETRYALAMRVENGARRLDVVEWHG